MKFLDEFRDGRLVRAVVDETKKLTGNMDLKMMEVCGTHTVAIFRSGLKKLLPENIRMISGPGCPVCVTPNSYLDKAVAYQRLENTIITTFGDMYRVPGSSSSLEREKARGGDIRVVYSTLDALEIAEKNENKNVVFLGVGFETTAPSVAFSVVEAERRGIENYFVLSGHKVIPPALDALARDESIGIDGLILPGHVSTIIGSRPYRFLAEKYKIPCVISGFEPLDIAQSIYLLSKQMVEGRADVEIQYRRSVKEDGNPKAVKLMNEIFRIDDSVWRGIGLIKGSGMKLRSEKFDAEKNIEVEVEEERTPKGCICGEVIKGTKTPIDCDLFGKVCTPETPVGACMVSSEGTCSAYYKYGW